MYVVFLKYIFVQNFNTSSESHQPIPWNCNVKFMGPRGRRPTYGAEGQGPRKTNILKKVEYVQLFHIKVKED